MLIDDIQQNFSSFSPGFWVFTENIFKVDEQMKKIFHLASNEIGMEDFLNILDERSENFMRAFLASSEINILNLKVKTLKILIVIYFFREVSLSGTVREKRSAAPDIVLN